MVLRARFIAVAVFIFFIIFIHIPIQAAIVEYNLTITQQEVNITGKSTLAMTINGSIPGPTLRFKEGDTARIHVHNQMDGRRDLHSLARCACSTQYGWCPQCELSPIMPGATFTYEFPIRHGGTYWYHSHTGLQEQKGVYGAFVIEPREVVWKADRDYVVMLSDWIDEDAHQVLRTLKRGSGLVRT